MTNRYKLFCIEWTLEIENETVYFSSILLSLFGNKFPLTPSIQFRWDGILLKIILILLWARLFKQISIWSNFIAFPTSHLPKSFEICNIHIFRKTSQKTFLEASNSILSQWKMLQLQHFSQSNSIQTKISFFHHFVSKHSTS